MATNPNKPMHFSIWYFLAILLVLVLVQTFFSVKHSFTVSYSNFRHLIDIKGVNNLEISNDTITGDLLPNGVEYLAKATKDPDLSKKLAKEFPKEPVFTTVRIWYRSMRSVCSRRRLPSQARLMW